MTNAKVKDAMSTNPQFIRPDSTLKEAAQGMRDKDCGCLPVGENDRLIGIVTDRDITVRAVAEGRDVETTPVRDVMTEGVKYVFEEDTLKEAGKTMQQYKNKIRRLVVLDNNKRLKGMLSVSDVVTRGKEKELVGEIESEVCQKAA